MRWNRFRFGLMMMLIATLLVALAWWRFGPFMLKEHPCKNCYLLFLQRVEMKQMVLDSLIANRQAEIRQTDYYLYTHNVQDEGYNMVAQHVAQLQYEVDSLVRTSCLLHRLQTGDSLTTRLFESYAVLREDLQDDWRNRYPVLSQLLYEENVKPVYGYGCYRDSTGAYYEGFWWNGMRHEFGFSVGAQRQLRLGEWKTDRYLGERLTYRADRIYGIDISKYQHGKGKKKCPIDWEQLRITHLGSKSRKKIHGKVDYPVSFVYIKSTEGTTILNPFYRTDYQNAHKHGFRVGTYHFFSLRSSAAEQAAYFLKHTIIRKGDFPPVLDVEPSHAQIASIGGADELFRRIRIWMNIVESRTGVRPILYISQGFVNRYLSQAPDVWEKYQVWIARYGEYKPDVKLVHWQLSPDGRVRGIHGEVDINVFNGYQEQFDNYIATL